MSVTERKRLRLSLLDTKNTPHLNSDNSSHKNSETSVSSEDLLTSSEHLFNHDTIDLSSENKAKDYVRISKQEYEEIKSRVSAIETRLSQEFTAVAAGQEAGQGAGPRSVQQVYQQTLQGAARLSASSDQLARRLSRELKIRPDEHPKIIRSPSARKIGSIRRRSKENTNIVRHKSWNVSTHQASHIADRFYPYAVPRRPRTSTAESQAKMEPKVNQWDNCGSDCINKSDASLKYHLRKRSSLSTDLNRTIGRPQKRRSLNSTLSNTSETVSDNSANITLDSSAKSDNSDSHYQNVPMRKPKRAGRESPAKTQQKWKSAAAFFMDKTGELDNSSQSGRPSVNKLRSQNAGAVLAKARLFETSSDKSSEHEAKAAPSGFARRPRVSGHYIPRNQKPMVGVRGHVEVGPCVARTRNLAPTVPGRQGSHSKDAESWRTPLAPPRPPRSPQPALRKPLCTPRTAAIQDSRKIHTPMKAVHISPRRRSPRQKMQR